ncbi:hypothetical protein L228DRAFT_284516 [Xylona heveae TC161]|uniref:MINDY deubiquitinase domain-containing protein n=1 Tax=Xylona heveae (strain CBS 132557 / TC161) TaxID=1328760 RepID=A0A165AIT3_XYLHT|nr:hypothetical protein L228DRAFT_284516 [Xylona heveae TC161]KZF20551.1 hypothetical protein L228DRAFT_284516 [Xylona heveae TC161]
MVLRQETMPPKILPPGDQQPAHQPPYPVTPSTPSSNSYFAESKPTTTTTADTSSPQKHRSSSKAEDDDSDESAFEWDASDDEDEGKSSLPPPLKVGIDSSKTGANLSENNLPPTLRVGPQNSIPRKPLQSQKDDAIKESVSAPNPWETAAHSEPAHHEFSSNNPFLPKASGVGETDSGLENSAAVWGASAPTSNSTDKKNDVPPVNMTANLSLDDTHPTNPYRTAHPANNDTSYPQAQNSPAHELPASNYTIPIEAMDPHRSESSLGWDPQADISSFDAFSSRNRGLSEHIHNEGESPVHKTWDEQQEWEKTERERRDLEAHEAAERATRAERERQATEEWYSGEMDAWKNEQTEVDLDDVQPPPGPPPSKQADPGDHTRLPVEEVPPPRPPKPDVSVSTSQSQPGASGGAAVPSPTTINRQRSETYQIKQINWYDNSSETNPRRSPILIQNANGPCPLLALVNALVLSTPSTLETALVETLRVREQVSLGLLLDAVFDELMSGRHGGAAAALPDVSELYAFLINLHTGMNVNPSFVPIPAKIPNLIDFSDDPSTHASTSLVSQAGGFEETRELKFYSTFSIPLIHGWLPSQGHPAEIALARSGKTYEDAQNLQFREEELEDKLQRDGLTTDEQQLLEDVGTIKYFLSNSATQLTSYGLETMKQALTPGAIAILFRNDHFSTLYKHPRTGQLLTLVTDAGFASHEEVVWQSLVDVNGEGSEFLSGDFRPVGNMSHQTAPETHGDENQSSWTTVSRRNTRHQNRPSEHSSQTQPLAAAPPPPAMDSIADRLDSRATTANDPSLESTSRGPSHTRTTSEQEDHDLALALQLQEEEEDRHRREQAARQREESLSQQYIASEAQPPPARRGERGARPDERGPSLPPRHGQDIADDAPPPSYEQAARRPAYHPPNPNAPQITGTTYAPHPPTTPVASHQQQGPTLGGTGSRRRSSAYADNRASGSVLSSGTLPPSQQQQQQHRMRPGGTLPQRGRQAGVQGLEDEGKKDCIVM